MLTFRSFDHFVVILLGTYGLIEWLNGLQLRYSHHHLQDTHSTGYLYLHESLNILRSVFGRLGVTGKIILPV
jgi:hypothetical protein